MLVLLAIATVLACILVFRLHAFLTLLLGGLLVAVFSSGEILDGYTQYEIARGKMSAAEAATLMDTSAVKRLAMEFGGTAGKIGILIALASVIGQCLLESRAAVVIVDRMLAITGPKRAPEALAASSYLLGIPVFFDTVFYLMVPLARSLRARVGQDYVLFILAILAGGSLAHSLIPPTPGPLMVAEIVGVDISTMMLAGMTIGLCSSVAALAAARLINRFVEVPLRPIEGTEVDQDSIESDEEASANLAAPSLVESLLPILLPVILIAAGSLVRYLIDNQSVAASSMTSVFLFVGDKNIALAVGLLAAIPLVRFIIPAKRKTLVNRSLASAGNIILITAAGGAFGAMLRQAGIEQTVANLAGETSGLMILPLAFLVTAAIRTLQGSATVAMITAAGVLQGFASAESLDFHPVYLAMAIGAGSKPVSWMTDSAFWVITRMSGMTEAEGLRVISPMSIAMGVSALIVTMIFAMVYPGI